MTVKTVRSLFLEAILTLVDPYARTDILTPAVLIHRAKRINKMLDSDPPTCPTIYCRTPLHRTIITTNKYNKDYISIQYKCRKCKSKWLDKFDGSDLILL